MADSKRRIALTKRALEDQYQRAGATRRKAERACAAIPHAQRWARLHWQDRARIYARLVVHCLGDLKNRKWT